MFKTILSILILAFGITAFAQDCEIAVKNVSFESANSMTFDVFLKNNSASPITYSHGSYAWTYNVSFLNGGTPTFSLVPGFSDLPAGAYPPSALVTSPNIVRTSSNMPGSNGTINAGQSLRLYKFRLQTSAASFASQTFGLTWKSAVTPYSRLYTWNSVSGLPSETATATFKVNESLLVDNFEYTGQLNALGWTIHSGTTNFINTTGGLTYPNYPGSGLGNAALISNLGGEDINKGFTEINTNGSSVYYSIMVNVTEPAATKTGDYFFMIGDRISATSFTAFSARLFVKVTADVVNFGISNTSTPTYGATSFAKNTTYLIIVKYTINTDPAPANMDNVALWVIPTGIPYTEAAAGTPEVLNTTTVGQDVIDAVAFRQGSNTTSPQVVVDGIRIATTWEDIFPPVLGDAVLAATPSILTGLNYLVGGGPSLSQSFSLSGANLTPSSGNVTVAGSTNYEVSSDNSTFGPTATFAYSTNTLNATPVYARLKAGLPGGVYNSEALPITGGNAPAINVTCNGAVLKAEADNHVTSFNGALGIPPYATITLTWTDAIGTTVPDGYLVRCSPGVDSIYNPVDGTPVATGTWNINVAAGVQTCTFTALNSLGTYYFKIFPYTNTLSNINYKTDGAVPAFNLATPSAGTLPMVEKFEYPTGSTLVSNGWIAHSGAGTNAITVNADPLTYSGYFASGQGKSVTLTTSGEDANHAYDVVSSGSVYASFMVKIDTAKTAGDYFFHLGPQNTTFSYYARTFAIDSSGHLGFGIGKQNTTRVYTPCIFEYDVTYLIVVKYTFNSGTTSDDEVSLWVNPVLNGVEPTPDVTSTDATGDAFSLGMVALRQGTASNAAPLTLGGIRVADSWLPGGSPTTFPLTVNVTDGWNMVSVPGTHPTNMNVDTWWSGRNPLASVYKWTGTYAAVTVASPREGYWMLHNGPNTYNTGDEWPAGGIQIVAHDPIPVTTGWNMIGGYDGTPLVSALTTTPPGLIVPGTVYGWSGSYANATNLNPGYGYWVLINAPGGFINIPSSSAKGVLAKEDNKDTWGKITLTDASGKSFTLYSVNGEVNLDSYQMPPMPPSGAFDVRYSSGRRAEDLSKASQTIDMAGIQYPVRVSVENTSIRLQDGTAKGLNTILKAGESVSISRSEINKLLVSADIIPVEYSLGQNYPNPFNPSTLIQFSLPEDVNNVTLTVYDGLGQQVAELVNGKMQAGYHQYQWNASENASGIYIYQLRTEKFVSTKKMMLLK